MKHLKWALAGLVFLPQTTLARVNLPSAIQPLTGGEQLGTILERVINWVLTLAAALAVIYLIYGGIIYITAAGNEEKTKAGKNALIGAVIGLVIIFLSYLIIGWVGNILRRGMT
jgi:hypothetical protein